MQNSVMGIAQDGLSAVNMFQPSLLAEDFLEQHYVFRRNVLRGQVEYRRIEEDESLFRPLTQEALNSIYLASKRALGEDVDIRSDIKMIVDSEEPENYNPVEQWLSALPAWDGEDRVMDFWRRIPGLSVEQVYLLSIWHRSCVVHWLGMDREHANECVPLLIGDQGCGKSTFCLRLLPQHLRTYYMDHFNLVNKFDKEMALSNSLLICLDEMDQYKTGQMAELKQALSKVCINGRRIYGRTIDMRKRFASFIATTNNRHPLCDPTGSRRYICLEVPKGQQIDNLTAIDYDQLYAQLVHEVTTLQQRSWFTREETIRLQELNASYEKAIDLQQMLTMFFSVPETKDASERVSIQQIRQTLKEEFPNIPEATLSSERIGRAMRSLSFESQRGKKGMYYIVAFRKAA